MMAWYCRVSSPRQKTDSQKAEIVRRWLQGCGIPSSAVQWFEDTETGTTLRRPAFERLQHAIFAGTIRTVVMWKLDRLSRRQRDRVNVLADWCERGVRVVVVTQQLDLDGAVGRTWLPACSLGWRRSKRSIAEHIRPPASRWRAARRVSGTTTGDHQGPTRPRRDPSGPWVDHPGNCPGPRLEPEDHLPLPRGSPPRARVGRRECRLTLRLVTRMLV